MLLIPASSLSSPFPLHFTGASLFRLPPGQGRMVYPLYHTSPPTDVAPSHPVLSYFAFIESSLLHRTTTQVADSQDYVLSVAISPDGQWVVSGSKDRSIQFWNIASGQAQFMLQGHKNSVISIDLARSGGYLASGSGDCQARIWKYDPL